jgi:hypothetical protein
MGIYAMHAHFIVRDGLYVRAVAFPVFESGYHAITEDEAKALVGGTIYLHQTKADRSYFSGAVTSYRAADPGEFEGRFVFTVTSTGHKLPWEGRDHQREHYSGLIADEGEEVIAHRTAGGNELVFHAAPLDEILS